MSQFKRQHPVAALTRVTGIVKQNFITIIIVLVMGRGSSGIFTNGISLFVIVSILLLLGSISWWRYVYRIEDGELKIEHGLFVRKKLYIPKERIQVIDTSSGFIQRMFGLVSLKIRTASGEGGATLEALTKDEATAISEQLESETQTDRQKEAIAGAGAGSEAEAGAEYLDETSPKPTEPVAQKRIADGELLLSAVTSGSIGIIATIIGSISSELDTLMSESQIYEFLENVVGSGWQMLLILAVGFLLASILLAFIGTLIKYARFSIKRQGDTLTIERGLIERKTIRIPLNRIQAIRIEESLLRQPLGRCAVSVSSAGYGDEDGKVTTLFPLLRTNEIHQFLQQFVPSYAPQITTTKPPAVARRRYIFRKVVAAIIFSLILYVIVDSLWFFLLVIPAILLGNAQFNTAAIGTSGPLLTACYRLINRKTIIAQRQRIQATDVQQSVFQQYNDLADIAINIASGKGGHTATVRELDRATCSRIQLWLTERELKEHLK